MVMVQTRQTANRVKNRLSTIVIGYGSPLRGDDVAGGRVATTVARWRLPAVRVIAVHQLTPELAEPLARVDQAIFVDARAGRGGVRVRRINPVESFAALEVHIGDPALLLALAQALYGRSAQAWLVTIPAEHFELGAPLSPLTRRALPIARRRIRRLIENRQ
jgi:hydrogenase maturation protease